MRQILVIQVARPCAVALGLVFLSQGVSSCTAVTAGEAGTPAEARWSVPSALTPTGSLVNFAAATDSVFVVAGTVEVVGYRASDGGVLWKRSDVPSLMPLAVDDSLLLTLSGGPSAALRVRDGQVLWRSTVPGGAVSVLPIQVGRSALTTNFGGDLFAVEVASGAVRQIGSMQTLAGGPGRVWGFVGLGGDTVLVVSQLETDDQGRGAIVAARVLVSSGAYLGRAVLPFARDEFVTAQRAYVQDSLLILPITGGIIAMDRRSGSRIWKVVNNSIDIVVRNREVYSASGTGNISVLDAATGRVTRQLDIGSQVAGAINDLYPCREGIFFTSGGMWYVQNSAGSRPRKLAAQGFTFLFPHTGTLYSSANTREIALRCT